MKTSVIPQSDPTKNSYNSYYNAPNSNTFPLSKEFSNKYPQLTEGMHNRNIEVVVKPTSTQHNSSQIKQEVMSFVSDLSLNKQVPSLSNPKKLIILGYLESWLKQTDPNLDPNSKESRRAVGNLVAKYFKDDHQNSVKSAAAQLKKVAKEL